MTTVEFDLEKYRLENPMDYIKAIELINQEPQNSIIPMTIYQITRLHIPERVYKYYSITNDNELNNIKLETLLNKWIYLADSSSMNDPFDSKAFFYRSEPMRQFERLKSSNGKLIDDFSAYIRLTCFTSNGINNMPMWAHYANNHSGYCVEYNTKDKENVSFVGSLFPVQYIDERIDITNIMISLMVEIEHSIEKAKQTGEKKIVINNLIMLWIGVYFSCLKHTSWSYERELRCIISSSLEPYIGGKPSSIYVGANCSVEYKDKLINIAKSLRIPIYQMSMDDNSLRYELAPNKIEL